jgi:hypothetical protein
MPLIILQSNQPNPAAVMAMTDDGDEPQQYVRADATAHWHEAKLDESIILEKTGKVLMGLVQ